MTSRPRDQANSSLGLGCTALLVVGALQLVIVATTLLRSARRTPDPITDWVNLMHWWWIAAPLSLVGLWVLARTGAALKHRLACVLVVHMLVPVHLIVISSDTFISTDTLWGYIGSLGALTGAGLATATATAGATQLKRLATVSAVVGAVVLMIIGAHEVVPSAPPEGIIQCDPLVEPDSEGSVTF